ncbi:hypothetical protein ABN235_18905, partial [Morganella morganii]|uniref:hypothetical protein n=1 Tax=Morganella morganii TaxID=582 RepID=UPI0032DBC7E1
KHKSHILLVIALVEKPFHHNEILITFHFSKEGSPTTFGYLKTCHIFLSRSYSVTTSTFPKFHLVLDRKCEAFGVLSPLLTTWIVELGFSGHRPV